MSEFEREYERNVVRMERIGERATRAEAFPAMTDAELYTVGVRVTFEWLEGKAVSPVSGVDGLSLELVRHEQGRAYDITADPDRVQRTFAAGIAQCLRWVTGGAKILHYPADTPAGQSSSPT